MPVFGALFMIVLFASAGLPGLNGFVGEFMILLGAFLHHQDMVSADLPLFIWHSRLMAAIAALAKEILRAAR